jgi:hypothetical protein
VHLYSVDVLLGEWVRMGCARLCGVHSKRAYLSVGRVPGCSSTCGAISLPVALILAVC